MLMLREVLKSSNKTIHENQSLNRNPFLGEPQSTAQSRASLTLMPAVDVARRARPHHRRRAR